MDTSNTDENKFDDNVLYELLVYAEWELKREKYKEISNDSLVSAKKPKNFLLGILWNIFKGIPWPEKGLAKAGALLLPWEISVSPNGKLVAILQDSVLEIRQYKDGFSTICGRASVPKDDRKQLRKIAWSPESNMIAISTSDGSVRIFDWFACLIFKIPLLTPEKPIKKLIVGLEFVSSRDKKGEWELLIIYANGTLECFNISSLDQCTFCHFATLSESGISCTAFSSQLGILFASIQPSNFSPHEGKKNSSGITAWRLLNESPYYEKVFPTNYELGLSKLRGKMGIFFSSSDCICKIVMAPNNQYIASLHSSGIVYIWLAPSLRFHSYLNKLDFKRQKSLMNLGETSASHVVDVEWKKDSKLIAAWKNGCISVHDVITNVILAYFGPDFLHSLPRLASASLLHGFLALECESESVPLTAVQYSSAENNGDLSLNESRLKVEESSSDKKSWILRTTYDLFSFAMYLLTDLEKFEPRRKSLKFIKRTYRLLGVKMTTPDELFERCLKNEAFDRAFEICEEYGLDVAKIYMRQWRVNDVTEYSIQEYLANVEDEEWVINECLKRIPESLLGAEKLIEFGLNFTNIKSILDAEASELSDNQKFIIVSRLKLLNYARKLKTYELIFNDSTYSSEGFKKFRKQSIVCSAVDFARSAQTEALKILMTHHGHEVLPYWLNILDNYPESTRPRTYCAILPECDGDLNPIKWDCIESEEDNDWASLEYSSQFCNLLEAEDNETFSEVYIFNGFSLSEWYKKRAMAIEELSTLIENSVELLELGCERNIQDLGEMLYEFKMLSSLVYELNCGINFLLFHNKDIPGKLQLFIQEPNEFCANMLKWIHPSLEHYADRNSDEWLALFSDFMIINSKKYFGFMIEYFLHILNGNLYIIGSAFKFLNVLIDCVYAYEKLDHLYETEELIRSTIIWLSSLSEEPRKAELLNKLFVIEKELNGIKIMMKYGCLNSISSLHKVKMDVEESKSFIGSVSHSYLENLGANIGDWEKFLADLVDLQRCCFSSVPLRFIFQIYVSHMLRSGLAEVIEYTPNILCCSKTSQEEYLNYETSVQVVLEAAEHYFNSAVKADDNYMFLAKSCLLLIKDDDPVIQKELDLILAVKLLSDLGVTILPLQVRNTIDKMKLIKLCFEKNKGAYKSPHLIYKLSSKLHIFDPLVRGSESYVTLCIAEEAFFRNDFNRCSELCLDLITYQYQAGWKICLKLASIEGYQDITMKIKLIHFCLLHAPSRILPKIKNIRRKLDTQDFLRRFLKELIHYLNTLSTTTELEEFIKALESASKCPAVPNLLSLLNDGWNNNIKNNLLSGVAKQFSIATYYFNCSNELCDHSLASDYWSVSNKLLLINNLLKLVVIASDGSVNYDFFSSVISCCSLLSVSYDYPLSLCFLLCLGNPSKSNDFFTFYEESPLIYLYHCYYLGLKNNISDGECFFKSPYMNVSSLLKADANADCVEVFNQLLIKMKGFEEASRVATVEKGIDLLRFKVDEKYKTETIFGLALNEDMENLLLAIELSQKNNISLHEVIISHIISLLIDNSASVALDRIKDERILSHLKEKEEESLKRLMDTFSILSGTDYQQLIIFFSYIKAINNNYLIFGLAAKDHLTLLKKLKSLSKEVNYKDLIIGETKLTDLLRPIMNDENFYLIAKFLKSLPPSLISKKKISDFFCSWLIEEFFSRCSKTSFKQCILNFKSLNKFFSKLPAEEIKSFVGKTLLIEETALNMESGVRKQLITILLDWCVSNNTSEEFNSLIEFLQINLDLLNSVWDEEYDTYHSELKQYLFLIEKAQRENREESTLKILEKALLDLSLSKTDALHLHKISDVQIPLESVIKNLSSSHAEREWLKRFDFDEDFPQPESIQGDIIIKKPEEDVSNYNSILEKLFDGKVPEGFFLDIDYSDKEKCLSSFLQLISISTELEQLNMIHRFMNELSLSGYSNQSVLMEEILKAIPDVSSPWEKKYLFAKELFELPIYLKVCEYLMERIQKVEPEVKLFTFWMCSLTNSESLWTNVQRLIDNEGENLLHNFIQIPTVALEDFLPSLFQSIFYHNLIAFILETENDTFLSRCIQTLEKSSISSSLEVKKEVATLKLHCFRLQIFNEETPSSLQSFHSLLLR